MDADGAEFLGLGEGIGVVFASGEPERQPERFDAVEVDLVFGAVDGVLVRLVFPAAGAGVVSAGDGTFDDEAVDSAGTGEGHGEDVGADDGEELGAVEGGEVGLDDGGVEGNIGCGAVFDSEAQGAGLVLAELVHETGDVAGDAGAHEDSVDACKEGSVEDG